MNQEEQQSMKLIEYFLENPDALRKLSRMDCKDLLKLASATAYGAREDEIKGKCYDLLYLCCFYMDLNIRELWQIYWILNGNLFRNSQIPFAGHLDRLYRLVFLRIKESMPKDYVPYGETASNLVVITTDQFLEGTDHAPTRRVLDYAYAIVTGLGKAVMIVNGAGLNYYQCRCLTDDSGYNCSEEFNRIRQVNYKGVNFPFRQLETKQPDPYRMEEALDEIYALQPELVYNIGASNLLGDLCGMFTKTCSFPCSSDIPISMSRYLLVGRKLEPSDSGRLGRLEEYQQTVETVINYQLPEGIKSDYTRSGFGLSDSDFVLGIVGNRLDTEIDDSFIGLMNRMLLDVDAHFLIVGEMLHPERITDGVSKPERVHFTGRIPGGAAVFVLFDVYLNPRRKGGGRSCFEALAQGVPALTFPYGDVYYTCGDEFAVADEAAFLETAARYADDPGYREEQKARAKKRAGRLSDIVGTQKEVLDQIL